MKTDKINLTPKDNDIITIEELRGRENKKKRSIRIRSNAGRKKVINGEVAKAISLILTTDVADKFENFCKLNKITKGQFAREVVAYVFNHSELPKTILEYSKNNN